jgi:6,7-dimethyl-8-ribityllumazine synthase
LHGEVVRIGAFDGGSRTSAAPSGEDPLANSQRFFNDKRNERAVLGRQGKAASQMKPSSAKSNEGAGKATEASIRDQAIAGELDARGLRFGIVVSRFNEFITERLLRSAYDGLLRTGAGHKRIAIVRVPGAFEIPSAARTLAETRKYDAILCLGCLIRGDTAHYDVIVNEVTRGIGQSAQETGIPHAFGVLTCDTLEQAIDRAGLKMGNKGFEVALAAVEMANLKKAIRPQTSAAAGRRKNPLNSQLPALSSGSAKRSRSGKKKTLER